MKNNIGIGTTAPQRLIHIKMDNDEYKKIYNLRARIGINILRLLGILKLELTDGK